MGEQDHYFNASMWRRCPADRVSDGYMEEPDYPISPDGKTAPVLGHVFNRIDLTNELIVLTANLPPEDEEPGFFPQVAAMNFEDAVYQRLPCRDCQLLGTVCTPGIRYSNGGGGGQLVLFPFAAPPSEQPPQFGDG